MINFRIITAITCISFSFQPNLFGQTPDSLVMDTLKSTFVIYKFPIDQNFVAISALPESKFLESDLKEISDNKIIAVITLVETSELESSGIGNFFDKMEENKIRYFHFPIQDYGVPTKNQMDSIYAQIVLILEQKGNVLIHCKGGLGRSGTVIASFLSNFLDEENPIEYVRQIRGIQAIETKQQEQFVSEYVYGN